MNSSKTNKASELGPWFCK